MLPSGTGLVAEVDGENKSYYKLVKMEDEKDYYRFFSLREKKVVKIKRNPRLMLPWQRDILPPDEAICFGSSRGWLAFIHPRNCSLYLFNPFVHSHLPYLPLPPIQTLPDIISTMRYPDLSNIQTSSSSSTPSSSSKYNCITEYHAWKRYHPVSSQELCSEVTFFNKIVLSSYPSPFPPNHQLHHHDVDDCSAHQCTVMVIQGYDDTRKPAFCRIGDTAWTALDATDEMYTDLIYFGMDQNFYAYIETSRSIEAWDLRNPDSPKKTVIISNHIPPFGDPTELDRYLVDSSGELLMVVRYYTYHRYKKTLSFEVYKLDFVNKEWLLLPSLGHDRALFIGMNDAISVSPIDFPGLPMNCIYFTSPDAHFLKNSHDLGIFNFEDKRVTPIYYYDLGIALPSPWIVPSAQQ
ncbi:uncharacterized protein LOC132282081 [Cornus florida]|uniref:uncharacterized protein LOC132282081 n=1 Tax=Cornus florida TaxID=4283 RepID=UPI0028979A15|nr:uncharacterized protein LOC132282081 [Cornus florida]